MDVYLHPVLSKPWRPGFQVHNEAIGRTVGECVAYSWKVQFACANGHGGGWSANEIGLRFAADVTLDDIAERLVCKFCGSKEGALTIRNDGGELQRRNIEAYEAKRRDGGG